MKRILAGVIAVLAATAPVTAAEQPRYLPNRDAAITYRSTGTDQNIPPNLTIRYFAAGNRLRIEGGPLGYLLVDRAMERVELVMPQPRLVVEMPQGGGITDGFILGDHLRFSRTGQDNVLGRACTTYDVTAERARGKVCLTSDGLLLRGEGQGRDGRRAAIEAVSVALATQPPGLFSPPDGYRMMAIPR
jgi:hypothetical protein